MFSVHTTLDILAPRVAALAKHFPQLLGIAFSREQALPSRLGEGPIANDRLIKGVKDRRGSFASSSGKGG